MAMFAAFVWPTKYQYLGEVRIFGKIPALVRKNRLTHEIQFLYLVPKLFGKWRDLPRTAAQPDTFAVALSDCLLSRLQDVSGEERVEWTEDNYQMSPEDVRGLIGSFEGKQREFP